MKAKILQSFAYSANGIEDEFLTAGTESDIRDELVEGLVAAGMIEPMAEKKTEKKSDSKSDTASEDKGDGKVAGKPEKTAG